MWLLGALDVNNGAAGNTVNFAFNLTFNPSFPTDPSSPWTTIGTNVVTGGTTSIFNSTATLTVGAEADGSTGLWAGKSYHSDVVAAFDGAGTAVAAFDPQGQADRATSFASPTGETWTINQSGTPKAELIASPSGYDPYASGTKWGKWLARNPYSVGYEARVYDGEMGQTTAQMSARFYLIKGVDGPTKGAITLSLRDVFDRITARKAVCPKASRGELFADLTGSPATFTLFPSGIGAEYLSAGYVCIGSEIIQYTRSGDVMTVVARAAFNTTQADHKDEDLVQQVAVFSSMTAKNIVYALLVNEVTGNAGVPSSWIDLNVWGTASAAITELYTATIAKPAPIGTLVAELMEQAGFTIFPNVSTGRIDFVALRAIAPVAMIDDETWIKQDSFVAKRLDLRRVSQCWVHYGQKDPTQDLDKEENFHSRIVVLDAASEAPEQYGTPSVKTIFSRWIPQFGRAVAESAATRIVGLLRDPPLQAEFRVPASKASSLSLASTVTLRTADIQDAFGARRDTTHAIVRLKRDAKVNEVELRTLETKFGPTITDKTIYIADDVQNFVFRTEWEKIWGTPTGTDTPKCVLLSGIYVGGGSSSTYSFEVGTWPGGVVPEVQIDGEILPAGGDGGGGGTVSVGDDPTLITAAVGSPGLPGGNALRTTIPIIIRGAGVIRSGFGGGGGGGGGVTNFAGGPFSATGGGGGGARGYPPGNGAPGGFDTDPLHGGSFDDHAPNNTNAIFPAQPGTAGSRFVHGTGGAPARSGEFNTRQIQGGAGGGGMVNGGAAFDFSSQDSYDFTIFQAGGSAGARGIAISGFSLITFTGWTGTVDGTTTG
jgi:hypothetical protein